MFNITNTLTNAEFNKINIDKNRQSKHINEHLKRDTKENWNNNTNPNFNLK